MAALSFDHTCMGSEIVLSRRRRTAKRRHARSEFCNAIALSSEPLIDGELFEVRLDELHTGWGSSIVLGVTGLHADQDLSGILPSSACDLLHKTVLIQGSTVLVNGQIFKENFCENLDLLQQGARVGVAVVGSNLHVYINGQDEGVAYSGMAEWTPVRGVIDLNGCCVQVSLNDTTTVTPEGSTSRALPLRLCRCPGSDVQVSADRRSVSFEPLEDSGSFAVAVASRPLQENEVFEIDATFPVIRSRNSLVGLDVVGRRPTESQPFVEVDALLRPSGADTQATTTGDRLSVAQINGDICLLRNGSVARSESSSHEHNYPLVTIRNGAARVTVTPTTGESVSDAVLAAHRQRMARPAAVSDSVESTRSPRAPPMRFHRRTGRYAYLTNDGRTAYRISPQVEFNYAIVFGDRPLHPGEVFEVRIDEEVQKWSGGLEIGVTRHQPAGFDLPATTSDVPNGVWMLGRNGVVQNGVTRDASLAENVIGLKRGDRVGIRLTLEHVLHFMVNGRDLGIKLSNIAQTVYPIVDVYGEVSQVSICELPTTAEAADLAGPYWCRQPLRFHERCGDNVVFKNDCLCAARHDAYHEFNNGVCITNRPLKVDEFFEITIDHTIAIWSGCVELGVTTVWPTEMDFPETISDLNRDAWTLSGTGVLHNGLNVFPGYPVNPDRVRQGSKIGMIQRANGDLHFVLDGVDCGCAARVPFGVFGLVDLYGQCTEVSINQDAMAPLPSDVNSTLALRVGPQCATVSSSSSSSDSDSDVDNDSDDGASDSTEGEDDGGEDGDVEGVHASTCSDISEFSDDDDDAESDDSSSASAHRRTGIFEPEHFPGEAESAVPRRRRQQQQQQQQQQRSSASGTSPSAGDTLPGLALHHHTTTYNVLRNLGVVVRESLESSTATLPGVMRRTMALERDLLLSADAESTPVGGDGDGGSGSGSGGGGGGASSRLYRAVAATSRAVANLAGLSTMSNELAGEADVPPEDTGMLHVLRSVCGRNISIGNNGCTASRSHGFDHGVVFSAVPLKNGEIFQVRIESENSGWSGNLGIGIVWSVPTDASSLSSSAVALSPRSCGGVWLLSGSNLYHDGSVFKSNYCAETEWLKKGDVLGVQRRPDASLRFYLNNKELPIATSQVPSDVYAVVDVYGKAQSVSVISKRHPTTINATAVTPSGHVASDAVPVTSRSLRFHSVCGRNVTLCDDCVTAERAKSFNNALLFSARPLRNGEKFELRVEGVCERWSGSPLFGVTKRSPGELADSLPQSGQGLPAATWLMNRSAVFVNGVKVRNQCGYLHDGPLKWNVGDTFGVVCRDDVMHALYNGRELATTCPGVAKTCYAVLDLYGPVTKVKLLASASSGSDADDITAISDDITAAGSGGVSPVATTLAASTSTISTATTQAGRQAVVDAAMPRRTLQSPQSTCSASQSAALFKASLGLPDAFFDAQYDKCFCKQCHTLTGKSYVRAGDPPALHSEPEGWTLFALRLHPRAIEVHQVFQKWHAAFHGTASSAVRKILDTGFLLQPGDFAIGGTQLQEAVGHFNDQRKPAGFDTKKVFVSPSSGYAGHSSYARTTRFQIASKLFVAQVAFKVFIRPGSYTTGPQTLGAAFAQTSEPGIKMSEIEWSTKERGAIELCGLLIKVDPLAQARDPAVITL